MLGNAIEALIGAIYLDKGYSFTHRYVVKHILRRYLDIHELENYDDNYKSQLLEWCQKNGKTISYRLISRYKYEKRDRFKVGVFLNNKRIATSDDFNKKSAEQSASERAMIELGILSEDEDDD
jgi:ribonuclease-3